MSAHHPESVEHAFNDRADTYRHSNWHRDYAERLVQIANVPAQTTVIDAGTGMAARAIARLDPTIRVVGVDISEKMLDRARDEAARESLTNIRLVRGDATSLSDIVTERGGELIVCSAGLLYLPITEALSNWYLVLQRQFVMPSFVMTDAGSGLADTAPVRPVPHVEESVPHRTRDTIEQSSNLVDCQRNQLADTG